MSFDISITDDQMFEPNETFTVSIDASSLPIDVFVGNAAEATVTIVDDDGRIFFVIIINKIEHTLSIYTLKIAKYKNGKYNTWLCDWIFKNSLYGHTIFDHKLLISKVKMAIKYLLY